jgi:hypothetical protein
MIPVFALHGVKLFNVHVSWWAKPNPDPTQLDWTLLWLVLQYWRRAPLSSFRQYSSRQVSQASSDPSDVS